MKYKDMYKVKIVIVRRADNESPDELYFEDSLMVRTPILYSIGEVITINNYDYNVIEIKNRIEKDSEDDYISIPVYVVIKK